MYRPKWPLVALLNLLILEFVTVILAQGATTGEFEGVADTNSSTELAFNPDGRTGFWALFVFLLVELYTAAVLLCEIHARSITNILRKVKISASMQKYGGRLLHCVLFCGVLTITSLQLAGYVHPYNPGDIYNSYDTAGDVYPNR